MNTREGKVKYIVPEIQTTLQQLQQWAGNPSEFMYGSSPGSWLGEARTGRLGTRQIKLLNTRKGTEVTSFREPWSKHSKSNLAALGSSTSCENYSPWRKKSSIFNRERLLCIRRLNRTQIFCSFNLIMQLSRNWLTLSQFRCFSSRTWGPHHLKNPENLFGSGHF